MNWQEIDGSATGGGISPYANHSTSGHWSIAVDSGDNLYTTWLQDVMSGTITIRSVYVKKFDGNHWTELGQGSAAGFGISDGISACLPKMSLDKAGNPYIVWDECPSSGSARIHVKHYDGNNWVEVGISHTNPQSVYPQISIGKDDYPMVSWSEITGESTPNGSNRQIYIQKAGPQDLVPPVGSVVLNKSPITNQEAINTTSTQVYAYIDALDQSGVDSYRLSSDGANFGNWSALWDKSSYSYLLPTTLSDGDGSKTVFIQFKDKAGNISDIYTDAIGLDTSAGTNFGLSINNGAIWTNGTGVNLTIPANIGTAEMQLSNDGGFLNSIWEPYSIHKLWNITTNGNYTIPRTVYVRFRDVFGAVSNTFQDDIIYDPIPPNGRVAIDSFIGDNVQVHLTADDPDNLSGIAAMRVSLSDTFDQTNWEPYATNKIIPLNGLPPEKVSIEAQFRDGAGNLSDIYRAGNRLFFMPLILK
jgi:hypothetical protein